MHEFLQLTLANLTVASVYLLVGQGWNLTIAVSGMLNLALGEFYMLGGMLSCYFADHLRAGGPLLAAFLAMCTVAVLGFVIQKLILQQAGDRVFAQIVATVGVALILIDVARYAFGVDPVRPPALVTGDPVEIYSLMVTRQAIVVFAVGVLATIGLLLFFGRTDAGRAMRACADNPPAARGIGINVARHRAAAFTASAALAALAGILITPLVPITYGGGDFMALKGFMAIAIVGLGRFSRAPLGALFVASLEGYVAGYLTADYRDVLVLSVLLLLLFAQVVNARGWPRVSALRRMQPATSIRSGRKVLQ